MVLAAAFAGGIAADEVQAAVDIENLASDGLCLGEEQTGGRDVLFSAALLAGDVVDERRHAFGGDAGRRQHQSGRDGIDADGRRPFAGGGLGGVTEGFFVAMLRTFSLVALQSTLL